MSPNFVWACGPAAISRIYRGEGNQEKPNISDVQQDEEKRDQSSGADCLVNVLSLMNGWINNSLWVFFLGEELEDYAMLFKEGSIEA